VDVWAFGPSEVEPGRRLFAHELERRLLDEVALGPGDTALELASGFGPTCLKLAQRVRPGGRTICSDLRRERVAATRRLVEDDGATDVDVRVIDMLRIDLPDDSVDAILCRWGFMFAVPTATALRESRRVLRRARRLVFATWADPRRNPWITLVDEAVAGAGLSRPTDRTAPGQMFSLCEPARLSALLEEAGFGDVVVDAVELGWEYDDFDSFWAEEALIKGAWEDFLRGLPAVDRGRVQGRLRELLEPYRHGDRGYRVPGLSLLARAVAA